MGKRIEGEDWREWLAVWGNHFLLFARQQAKTKSEAEDILQEAIVHVWGKRHLFPKIEPGLVFLQIKRIAIDRARRETRRRDREEVFAEAEQPQFVSAGNPGLAVDIQQALGELPHEQREVIVLKVWAGQTFEAIAKALSISANTAASRYRYGLDRMRQQLRGELV